jgi:hypothetical protein
VEFPSIPTAEDRLSDAGAPRAAIAPDRPTATALALWPRAQAIVGVLTGVLSIAGALYSGVCYLMAPSPGEVAALVRESRTDRPIADATVEVLTPEDALVTTLAPAADGWIRHSLYAGKYHIRVTKPGFGSDTKPIQVLPGRSVEVRFHLTPRRGGFFGGDDGGGSPGPVSRFLGKLGL